MQGGAVQAPGEVFGNAILWELFRAGLGTTLSIATLAASVATGA